MDRDDPRLTQVKEPINMRIYARDPKLDSYKEHGPISINGNQAFRNTALVEGWPGNGTDSYPYIIRGFSFIYYQETSDLEEDLTLIEIRDTDLHFYINNCLLVGGHNGVKLQNVSNGYITNNIIAYTRINAITIIESNNISVTTCLITKNSWRGIRLSSANNNNLTGNTVYENRIGILHIKSDNSTIVNNTFSRNGLGIELSYPRRITITDNKFTDSGLHSRLGRIDQHAKIEASRNWINGKALIFWQNVHEKTVPAGAGQVILINCTSVQVRDQILTNVSVGLIAWFSSNLIINNNTIGYNNRDGFHLYQTANSVLENNNILNNQMDGGRLQYTSNITLIGNNILENQDYGIWLEPSNNITLSTNNIEQNNHGIWLRDTQEVKIYNNNITNNNGLAGIEFFNTSKTVIVNNTVAKNSDYGIYLSESITTLIANNTVTKNSNYGIEVTESQNNTISYNVISFNQGGIVISSSGNNTVKWNDFIGHSSKGVTYHVYVQQTTGIQNIFAYNYWDNWISPDADSDGIVDKPYSISGGSNETDFSPLTSPVQYISHTTTSPESPSTSPSVLPVILLSLGSIPLIILLIIFLVGRFPRKSKKDEI